MENQSATVATTNALREMTYAEVTAALPAIRAFLAHSYFGVAPIVLVASPRFDEDAPGERIEDAFPWDRVRTFAVINDTTIVFEARVGEKRTPTEAALQICIHQWFTPDVARAVRQVLSFEAREKFNDLLLKHARDKRLEAEKLTESAAGLQREASALVSLVAEAVVTL